MGELVYAMTLQIILWEDWDIYGNIIHRESSAGYELAKQKYWAAFMMRITGRALRRASCRAWAEAARRINHPNNHHYSNN